MPAGLDRRSWIGLALLALAGLARAAVPTLAELGWTDTPPALTARYRVQVQAPGKGAKTRQLDWTFSRDAERIDLLKGPIDEAWTRDAQGRIAFERSFHEHAQVVDYPTGELATLGVQADWAALATFIDRRELATLTLQSSSGHGPTRRLRLQGPSGDGRLRVDWLPALQIPALVLRDSRSAGRTRIELRAHAATAPPDWPRPGARSAAYLHLDAADFGDMDYEPVVRLSEALDIRQGWRQPHGHD